METLFDVLEEQVKDLYNAENVLAKALPKMAKKARTPELKQAFTKHLEETKVHIDRIKQVAEMLEIKPTGLQCKAMKGLIEEATETLEEDGNNAAIDAALICNAQRVEHYEMAAYGNMIALANAIGSPNPKVLKLLQTTLAEEHKTNDLLTKVAQASVYPGAAKSDDEVPEEELPVKKKIAKVAKKLGVM